MRLDGLPQSATANQGITGAYFLRDLESHYLLVATSVGVTGYRESRQINIGNVQVTAQGNYGGWQPSLYVEKGARLQFGRTIVQPYAALQYIYLRQNSFTESGAGVLDLSVAGVDTNALRGLLGTRVAQVFCTSWGHAFVPEVRALWMHEFLQPTSVVNAVFAPIGGGSFATSGLNFGRDWAVLGAGTQYAIDDQLSLFANYDLQFNSQQSWNAGSAGVQFIW